MRGLDENEIEHLNRLSRVRALLDVTPDTHITLVGDVMLDRFVTGEAETLATTAPAPALRVVKTNVLRTMVVVGDGTWVIVIVGGWW